MTISQKFTFWIIALAGVLGVLSAILYYYYEMSGETRRLEALGATIGPIVEESLDHSMMTVDLDVLNKTLDRLVQVKPIASIWLINMDGVIRASTDKKTVGTRLERTDPSCRRCHEKGQRGLLLDREKTFRWVQPVTNRPECRRCHSTLTTYNGVIVIDFSMAESEQYVKTHIVRGSLIFLLSLTGISLMMILLTRSFVIRRLNDVIERLKRFKEGDFVVRAPVKGRDEITKLEDGFNRMAEAITQRDRQQTLLLDQISRSEKEWEETFNSITDLISIQDKEFRIVRANRAFQEHFGSSMEDLQGTQCYRIFHGDCPLDGCPHQTTMRENQPAFAEVLNPQTNRIFQISTFPYCSKEGALTGSIHVARDVTEEKEREMRLTVSERLATLGQMASGLAHELNNPLASISACAEGLLRRIRKGQSDPELLEEYLKIIEEESSRCRGITGSMLSFVRKGTYDKKEIDLHEMLDNTLTIIGLQGRLKDVKVARNYGGPIQRVTGSEGELRQVLLTLITNAIDAMEDKGTLTLSTNFADNRVAIRISDTGYGIPQEHLEKIFETFFTTKADKGGVGLGLSIAKKIIESMGGTIDVASEVGAGSTLTVTIPV